MCIGSPRLVSSPSDQIQSSTTVATRASLFCLLLCLCRWLKERETKATKQVPVFSFQVSHPRCAAFFFLLLIFEIFTICFKEAISKWFERLHFEGRCYPVTVLPRVEHFLIIIVFYCNTSVGHCRCSLLLASGGTCSWFTCSFGCPVRFRRYLFVIQCSNIDAISYTLASRVMSC